MDLSNLLLNLPVTRPVTQESVDEINTELAKEFKNAAKLVTSLYNLKKEKTLTQEFASAAKSVASLYRLSNNLNCLNHYNGYLSCINDLLEVLNEDGDVENWALTKKAELTNMHKKSAEDDSDTNEKAAEAGDSYDRSSSSDTVARDIEASKADCKIPSDYEFSMGSDLSAPYRFRPSYPPLSVVHSARQRANWLQIKKEKEQARKRDDVKIEEETRKRKIDAHESKRKEQKKS